MKTTKSIGSLIKAEVEKQGLSAVEFGELICCERQNVYKIFARTHMDSLQLARISRALNHDFFADISKDITLSGVDDESAQKEVYNRMAIAQFCEVMPRVLYNMGIEPAIFIGRPIDIALDVPMPEYTINPFYLTFSTDKLLSDNPDCGIKYTAKINRYTDSESNIIIDRWIFKQTGFILYNMLLDYKTEKDWEYAIRFFFNNVYYDKPY